MKKIIFAIFALTIFQACAYTPRAISQEEKERREERAYIRMLTGHGR